MTAEVEARLAVITKAARERGHPVLAPCASRSRLGRDGRRVRWPVASGVAEPAREALPGNTRMRARAPPACGTA